jgi:hypothetical protein
MTLGNSRAGCLRIELSWDRRWSLSRYGVAASVDDGERLADPACPDTRGLGRPWSGANRYRSGMSMSAELPEAMVPPAAEPQAIRACLTPSLVAEFDSEWELVLEQAKQTKDLVAIHSLLNKWQHLAYAEMRDPGSYYRMLAKAEQIMRAGHNPSAGTVEDMRAMINRRLGR